MTNYIDASEIIFEREEKGVQIFFNVYSAEEYKKLENKVSTK